MLRIDASMMMIMMDQFPWLKDIEMGVFKKNTFHKIVETFPYSLCECYIGLNCSCCFVYIVKTPFKSGIFGQVHGGTMFKEFKTMKSCVACMFIEERAI